MANQAVRSISLLTTPDKEVRQHRFVIMVAAGTVEESAAGGDVVGIILETSPDSTATGASLAEASAARPVTCLDGSVQQIVAGATLAPGDKVASDAEGRAVVAGGASAGIVYQGGAINELITFISTKAG
jgi:hypothetical protein